MSAASGKDPVTETLDLVRDAQGGDRPALDRLIARYYPLVQKVVRLRMGDRLRQRLESVDILQETFAKAVQRFDRFEMRTEGSLINWLSKLAENTIREAVEHHGAQKRDVRAEVRLDTPRTGGTRATGAPAARVAAPMTIPLDQMIRTEEQALLEECLAALPPHYREVVLLRNFVGMSFPEIQAETGRPSEGAARMMHAKAMRELTGMVAARRKR